MQNWFTSAGRAFDLTRSKRSSDTSLSEQFSTSSILGRSWIHKSPHSNLKKSVFFKSKFTFVTSKKLTLPSARPSKPLPERQAAAKWSPRPAGSRSICSWSVDSRGPSCSPGATQTMPTPAPPEWCRGRSSFRPRRLPPPAL